MVRQPAVHAIGGVISPGEVIMLVVPVADDLTTSSRTMLSYLVKPLADQIAGAFREE